MPTAPGRSTPATAACSAAAPDVAPPPVRISTVPKGRSHRVGFHQAARGPHRRQAVEAEQTTASGLVIPDTAKEKPQEGEVLAIGPGRIDDNGNRVPLDVKVGDKVIYSKYGGTEVKYGGEEYLILSARDVLAVVAK